MNQTDFTALHAQCISELETYCAEARKTARMLGNCTPEPLPFSKRFALLSQEIVEKDAYLLYKKAKRLLHVAALLGYAAPPGDSLRAATLALVKG